MSLQTRIISTMRNIIEPLYRRLLRPLAEFFGVDQYFQSIGNLLYNRKIRDQYIITIGDHKMEYVVHKLNDMDNLQNQTEEREVIEDILSTVSTQDVVYDIGANRGLYTCFLAPHVQDVIAFEPNPDFISQLRQNIEHNDVSATVVEVGLGDTNFTTKMDYMSIETGETYSVEVRNGDQLIEERGLPSPTIIKIDIEGNELDALSGLSSNLEYCDYIYVELHPNLSSDNEIEDLKQLLRRSGFSLSLIHKRGDEKYLKATRK